MSYKNISFRGLVQINIIIMMMHIIGPIFYVAHTVSTSYYIDSVTGSDTHPGTDPNFPRQTLAGLSGSFLEPGDTVWLSCGATWNEDLILDQSGSTGLPITFRAWQSPYGGNCAGQNYPRIQSVTIDTKSHIAFSRVIIDASTGSAIHIKDASNIDIHETLISNPTRPCITSYNTNNLSISGSVFSSCSVAFSGTNIEGNISYNTFSGMTDNAISIISNSPVFINNNTFSNLQKGAIVFDEATIVSQNHILSACQGTGSDCSAIRNREVTLGTSFSSGSVSENIIKNIGSGITMNNYGIKIRNIDTLSILKNTVNNAERALYIENAKNLTIHNNTFALSRERSVYALQSISGAVHSNTFYNNTLLQKNPDYPYIELLDTTTGSTITMLSSSGTDFYPLYKPNTSYIREVKYGRNTKEYSRKELSSFDSTIDIFNLFGYKPYSNTGILVGGEMITNGSFSSDITGWSSDAYSGSNPSLSHNTLGSYSGGSLQVTPNSTSIERMWVTHNPNLTLIAGRYYKITGYLKSGSGNINISVFLHPPGNKNILYSDRIADTYASASGRVFSLYLQASTGASDARLSFESTNPDVSYEIDEISMIRVNGLTKNNDINEVHIISNPTSSNLAISCPGGSCGSYIDITGTPTSWPNLISWPITVSPYSTNIVALSGGINMLYPPNNTLVPVSGGSVDAGQPATVEWSVENGISQVLSYPTYIHTGGITEEVSLTGTKTFILPYEPGNYDISLTSENDAGVAKSTISITVNNTPPFVFVSSMTGTEDDPVIYGTLSGYDITPGDFDIFIINQFPSGSLGTLTLTNAQSGTVSFVPNPDVCGTVNFDFSARDIRYAFSQPITQPIQILCTNDAPVLLSNKSATGYTAIPSIIHIVQDVQFEDVDSLYQSQTFSLNLSQPPNGSVTSSGLQIEYTSHIGFTGSDSFEFSVVDQSGAVSATGIVNVIVTRPNNPPTATSTGYTINEDTILSDILTGSDIDGDPISFSLVTAPSSGTATVLSGGNFIYTPNMHYNGSDSFIFSVNDGSSMSTGVIDITIHPVPDAPVAISDSISPPQDTPTFIPVMINDSDPDSTLLTLTGYTNPQNGVITPTATGFLYTPNTGYVGIDTFTYRLEDETLLLSNIATVSINVTSTNNPPISFDISVSTNEDTPIIATLSGVDPDLDTLTYILNTGVSHGTLTFFSTGGFRYTPVPNYYGSDTFTYSVSDGILTSTTSLVTITILPVNDAPIAVSANYNVTPNTLSNSGNSLTGILSGSDVENSPLIFSSSTLPINGTLFLSSTGYFIYTPALGYIGSDSFSFFVNDGSLNSSPASITLHVGQIVSPPNSPPTTGPGGGGGGISIHNPIVRSGSVSYPKTDVGSKEEIKKGTIKKIQKKEDENEQIFYSAQEEKPTEFTLLDPTGLLSQLLLTNRKIGGNNIILSGASESTGSLEARQIFDETLGLLSGSYQRDNKTTLYLRKMLQLFILRASVSTDPLLTYDEAIQSVEEWEFDEPDLKRTKEYILRILYKNRKQYEELLYRNIIARFEDDLDDDLEILGEDGF